MDPKKFYLGYQINYFDYKQLSLKKLLESPDPDLYQDVLNSSKEEYEFFLRCEIRTTYLHSISTLFELINAFRLKDGQILDDDLVFKMISGEFPYKMIRKVKEDPIEGLKFLDEKVVSLQYKEEITLGHYIFYMGLSRPEINERVKESITIIKKGLAILASDFDQREYNGFKHGLRNYRALTGFEFVNPANNKSLLSLDYNNSYSFYSINKEEKTTDFITKNCDTERDILMTQFCSKVIFTIMNTRKELFLEKGTVDLLFFNDENLNNSNKKNIRSSKVKISLRNEQ